MREKWLHRLFKTGIVLKGVDGVLETAGGFIFLFVSRSALKGMILHLTQPLLLQDPDDWFAHSLRHALSHLSAGAKLFGSLYLLVHGVVKLFLVVSLLRGKLWSFPVAISVLGGFIGYQIYRVSTQFTWLLVFLTGFDIIIVLLVWHEYRFLKHRKNRPESPSSTQDRKERQHGSDNPGHINQQTKHEETTTVHRGDPRWNRALHRRTAGLAGVGSAGHGCDYEARRH